MSLKLYGSVSYCHNQPSLIVRSREGGFVTQNCLECGQPRSLPFSELPKLYCKECGQQLSPRVNIFKNYAYKCSQCCYEFELATIIPKWSEVFEYHGFPLESDDYEIHYKKKENKGISPFNI